MDAVSIANIQEVHDNQTLVSSTAINLTGRQLGRHVGLHKHDYRTRKLLTLYNCSEWAPPPPAGPAAAPAPDAPAQRHDNDNAHPLSLPLLNLLASLRARQDEENGENTVRPSLPPQRQVNGSCNNGPLRGDIAVCCKRLHSKTKLILGGFLNRPVPQSRAESRKGDIRES